MIDVLKGVEWVNGSGGEYCPACGYVREAGHRADCRIATLLAKAARPKVTWPDVYDVDETTGEITNKSMRP